MLRYNKSGGFNIPYGKYKSMKYEDLKNPEYERLLGRTEIYNVAFDQIFAKYNDPGNFMFLDPPYDSTFTDYGYCKFGKNEHEQLAKAFKATQNKCTMIIGKTDYICGLYDGYIVGEYDKKYKFRIHSGRVDDKINVQHLIITNWM
jgi:DNA adenine methylase